MITPKETEHIARLARMELTTSEKEKFASELAAILAFVEKLNEADTKNVKPMTGGTAVENIMRADRKPDQELEGKPAELIAVAPEKKEGWIRVKAIFE